MIPGRDKLTFKTDQDSGWLECVLGRDREPQARAAPCLAMKPTISHELAQL